MDKKKLNKFYKKYRHVGACYPSVPDPWKEITMQAIIDIEKVLWPHWIPIFLKQLINWIATGNSIIRVKNKWFYYNIYDPLVKGQITTIKNKYAGLCIYVHGPEEAFQIASKAEKECSKICEICGSKKGTKIIDDRGWYKNLCKKCQTNITGS